MYIILGSKDNGRGETVVMTDKPIAYRYSAEEQLKVFRELYPEYQIWLGGIVRSYEKNRP
jgi:hypothetical protein